MNVSLGLTTLHKIDRLPEEEVVKLIASSLVKQGVSPVSARNIALRIVKKVKANRG